jgi:hypothetical protein
MIAVAGFKHIFNAVSWRIKTALPVIANEASFTRQLYEPQLLLTGGTQ